MGMGRTFQEILFKTEYSELTDWIYRERERAEPEIKLWFTSSSGWSDEVPVKGIRKSEEDKYSWLLASGGGEGS